ncbi:MAG TPA: aspartyl protease family protein, partial [bacterium]|nr:aspartyl protease family protein [bacterium]
MRLSRSIWLLALAGIVVTSASLALRASAEPLTDPYQILARHYQAMGGLEKLKAEKTKYFEATVTVMGLQGTVKEWDAFPIKKRQEVDLKMFKQTSGDNGTYSWVVDQNGKLQVQKDDITLKKRQVEELMANYEHLNRDSKYFAVTLQGIEKVGSADCYVVKITNTINDDVRLEYINTASFMPEQSVLTTGGMETYTTFEDWRDVGGLKVPFKQTTEIKPIEQTQTVAVTKYESNLEIDPTIFEPPGKDVKDFVFAKGTSAEDIPFQYIGEHLFIDVTVNCDKRQWVLDTGAAASVVDSAYAASLGLETSGTFKAVGAGKTVEAAFVKLPGFSVDGIQFGEQKAASINVAGLLKRGGLDASGILGYDFLSRFVTKIDYAARRISFYDPDVFEYHGTGKVIDAALHDNFFIVPMSVAGKYSGTWSLDLGASGTSFFYTYAEKAGLHQLKGMDGLAGGAGGFFSVRALKFPSVEIGGFTLGEQIISVPLEKTGALGAGEVTGNLGNDILRHFVVYLDYKRQQVILEKGSDFDKVFPNSKTGLGLV